MATDTTAVVPDRWIAAFNARHDAPSVREDVAINCRILFTDAPPPGDGFHLGAAIDPAGPIRASREAAPDSILVTGPLAAFARGVVIAWHHGPAEATGLWPELAQHIKVTANPDQAAVIVARLAGIGDSS